MSTLDLNNPPPGQSYTFAVERHETAAEQAVRLFKDLTIFLLGVAFIVLLVYFCCRTLLSSAASPDAQKWAMSIFSLIGGGVVGYLVPRK